jgi:putative nucleotidyltransferase with HDIG domain
LADRQLQLWYIGVVTSLGLVVLVASIWQLSAFQPGVEWFLLATLTLLTGSFTVKLPSLPAKISVSETFVFTSVLLFGTSAGVVTVVLDALVISLWMKTSKPRRVFFNATAPAIALWASSTTFFYVTQAVPGQISREDVAALIAPMFAFAFLYFLVNTTLVAGALATERKERFGTIWWENFPPVSTTYFVGGSIALLIVAYTDHIDLTVLMMIIPLLVISYLTFRTSMGRLEDANRHIAQISEMYLSTIETLAMAVDAKDQITHGHIRRVQVFAVELAKRLGVREEHSLKGIEAAALLHDMGKLAIPEHILNKPGKLTEAEFNKMKRHADIGADLLSSIRFPYPVVPIVRHHHENWNGMGYPTGLAGTDIPLGARILSVVDCFDALTSDRPYRPRLSDDEAFQVLRERRGNMYDPLVVDTFIAAHPTIAPAAILAGQNARSLLPTMLDGADGTPVDSPLRDIRATAIQSSQLSEYSRELQAALSLGEAIELTGQYVRMFMPAAVCAVYNYDSDADILICVGATGDPQQRIRNLAIRRGDRISGWAAANETTIANSDATLDLGATAETFVPPLRSALSTPINERNRLIGVLTVYAERPQVFGDDHKYLIERVANLLGPRLVSLAHHPVLAFRAGHNNAKTKVKAER